MANKKRTVVLVLVTLLAFCAVVVGIGLANQPDSQPHQGLSLTLDENAKNWDASGVAMDANKEGIKIPGYGTIYFPKQTKNVPLTLYNPKENNCYFVFELCVDDAKTPIYTTGYIEPGKAVTELSLTKGLSAGHYTLFIKISTYDRTTKAALNGAEIKAPLVVQ